MKFHTVIIIFNPISTGDSEKNALDCYKELKERLPSVDVRIIPTEFAGHAQSLAAKFAGDRNTLIISSSGDGGYNEVINGVLQNSAKAVTAVLPSGNANDHHRALSSGKLYERIEQGTVTELEVLEVTASIDGAQWRRFAHSYVGFGLTPSVGKVLTERRPNVLTEKWYVLRQALRFRSVPLRVRGRTRRYGNLICSTIPRMSKIIKLAQDASTHDGKMEVYETYHVSLLGLIKQAVQAALGGLSHVERTQELNIRTIKPTLVQLDGEVFKLDKDSDVRVACKKGLFRTVV